MEAAEYELDSGFRNPTTVLIVFKPVNTVIPDGGIKADDDSNSANPTI